MKQRYCFSCGMDYGPANDMAYPPIEIMNGVWVSMCPECRQDVLRSHMERRFRERILEGKT